MKKMKLNKNWWYEDTGDIRRTRHPLLPKTNVGADVTDEYYRMHQKDARQDILAVKSPYVMRSIGTILQSFAVTLTIAETKDFPSKCCHESIAP